MSYDTIRRALEVHFKATFMAPQPFPVAFENVKFSQPANEPWGRFSIRFGKRENASVGTDHKRTLGLVFLQVFIPESKGTKPANDAADRMATAFDDKELETTDGETIQVRTVELDPIGMTGEGWHQTNLVVPFWADKIAV